MLKEKEIKEVFVEYLNFAKIPKHIEEYILESVKKETEWLIPYDGDHSYEHLKSRINKSVKKEKMTSLMRRCRGHNFENSFGEPQHLSLELYSNEASFVWFDIDDIIYDSIKSLLPISFDKEDVFIMVSSNGDIVPPHIDDFRKSGINYIIESGGENVTTNHYKPKKEYEHLICYPRTIFLLDKLDLIHGDVIKEKSWFKLDTKTIHSVQNINPHQQRISLTICDWDF
jgi:hypothetical protein